MEMDAGTLMAMMKDNDGFEFIWILLIFLIFGFGGNGFGGNREGGISDLEAAVKAANCSQSEMGNLLAAINGNRDAIGNLATNLNCDIKAVEQGINGLSSGICDLGYKVGMDSRDILQAICTGNNALQAQLAECCCQTQRSIDNVRYDMATMGCSIEKAIADCCCATQMAIKDSAFANAQGQCEIKNQMSAGFCDLNHNLSNQITNLSFQQQQGFQSIINHMNAQETDRLRTDLQSCQSALAQANQTRNLEEFIRQQCNPCCPCPCPCPPVSTLSR